MFLTVTNIIVKARSQPIIDNISFGLSHNTALSIIGPSGSGKTTVVKTILGIIEHLDVTGAIYCNDRLFQENNSSIVPRNKRQFGYIPQDLALWPHISVEQCLRLSLLFSQSHEKVAKNWLPHIVDACGLSRLLDKKPKELSGGEQQRLAIARALVVKPQLLVLDEPFSALDVVAKKQLIALVKQYQELLKLSLIFISHDLADSMNLGQEVMILHAGKMLWHGPKDSLKPTYFAQDWNPMP